ncbi:MAG: hypothetical protein ACM30H_11340 [Clostridia bacterium]
MFAPPPRAALVAAILMAVIAFYDAHTSEQLSLWPLYIAPVSLLSWRYGFFEGGISALLSGALLAFSAIFSGHPYSSSTFFFIATMSQIVALVVIAWFAARLCAVESTLQKLLVRLTEPR